MKIKIATSCVNFRHFLIFSKTFHDAISFEYNGAKGSGVARGVMLQYQQQIRGRHIYLCALILSMQSFICRFVVALMHDYDLFVCVSLVARAYLFFSVKTGSHISHTMQQPPAQPKSASGVHNSYNILNETNCSRWISLQILGLKIN